LGRPSNSDFSADPGAGYCDYDERERIPLRPIFRAGVVGTDSAGDAQDKADDADRQCVVHWPMRSESRRNVATCNTVNNAVSSREYPEWSTHRLEPWRKDARRVHQNVRDKRKNNDGEQTGENCADASKDVAWLLSFTHKRPDLSSNCLNAYLLHH
jgi:hypothetical protein